MGSPSKEKSDSRILICGEVRGRDQRWVPSARGHDLPSAGVSLHYEIVISCFLDESTPEDVLDVLRWHLGLVKHWPGRLHEESSAYPLWAPNESSYLPGGEVARLQRQTRGFTSAGEIYGWGLYAEPKQS
jgi:hypothetical protein